MKKMRIALASMLVAAGITATAGAANFTNCADRLKDVGLFQGTNQGYQLDKAPTHRAVYRSEGLGKAVCAVPVR